MVTSQTLVGIAAVGGLITSATGYALYETLQQRVRDSPVYKEAMTRINLHDITSTLGKPIKSQRVDVGNTNNVLSLTVSSLELPIYGPNGSATAFIRAQRDSSKEKWQFHRLEVQVENGKMFDILAEFPTR